MITNQSFLPLTGQEYLESLKDGREVWLDGERIKDVGAHPAFRNSARSVARLYDALHDPKYKDVLTTETDTGSGGYTHKFFRSSHSVDDLIGARDAIAEWSRLGYGYMGRSPDFKAAFLGGLGPDSEFYGPYKSNAVRWYREAQEKVWYFNHAFIHPPVDRHKPLHEAGDVFVHVEQETDAGLIVSGAKMVATGCMLTNYTFVAHYGPVPVQKEEYALAFIVEMGSPGVKLLCRPSYEMTAAVTGSPFDYPLSSRFDENDAVLIFDKVLIPWENVLVYRDMEKANSFLLHSGYSNRAGLHGSTRLAVKLDFVSGLLLKAIEMAGTNQFRGVQVQVGEVLAWRDMMWALSTAAVKDPTPGANGSLLPNMNATLAYRVFGGMAWTKVKDIVENVVAGGLIVQPSSTEDFKNPEIRPYLDKYFRGSNGYDAVSRNKLIKLLWDAMGSEFGGRHELYERNYTGNHENIRLEVLGMAMGTGEADKLKGFVDQCMSEYDLEGWTSDRWVNNDDMRQYSKV
ncbi:4-hydroxyphenylacetate 3-hydroxylase N-terminal domain-containing protein [Paenibacillus validus]|uniref:4-hydroxyphenylacetate 3-hydroxylase N-terminal domain-containing protein n=1 Tax=Paenibacillus validus TaxID=44253 RepID=UPI000FD92A84|nr:4-hydroxyphenylacetate 3-hydroxylase N-terminal domain-containing protein [Paenibacillus validus]MED4599600.1 4-hydroxyphenylacetate 3-hydroxylase N-terminal domain-containing protein [Paenibacillus validus]MED4604635.1 4-hydroxyphenylacetate 3-hydroxylase N-terminal domain-containing protein [Paenibacillus validus]